jgi:hypothetical protein
MVAQRRSSKKRKNLLNTELLKESLIRWYEEDPLRTETIKVILDGAPIGPNGEKPPSRREIEYCVINYAKKNGVHYFIHKPNGEVVPFNMYASYKSTGKNTTEGKDNFDPFRRGDKFDFHGIEVTVGFLNFFRWAIENKVLDYVRNNAAAIEKDMSTTYKKRNREKKLPEKKRRKKKELNPPNAFKCFEYSAPSNNSYAKTSASKPFKSVRQDSEVKLDITS